MTRLFLLCFSLSLTACHSNPSSFEELNKLSITGIGSNLSCFKQNGEINLEKCGFSALLKQANTKTDYQKIICDNSPWKYLNLSQRAQAILTLSEPHAERYHVDAETMLCIAGRETTTLEPLTVADTYWQRRNKDPLNKPPYRGLGQIMKTTFNASFYNPNFADKEFDCVPRTNHTQCRLRIKENGRRAKIAFRSQIYPFNLPPYTTMEGREMMFDALAVSPNLQLELMAYTLSHKAYHFSRIEWKERTQGSLDNPYHGSILKTLMDYNAHNEYKIPYARTVNECRNCLLEKESNQPEDIVKCLDHVMPRGSTAERQFDLYKKQCEAFANK